MHTPLRVLLVEDSEDDALLVLRALQAGGYQPAPTRVDTPEAMRAALADGAWDLVISDFSMPKFSGPAALELLQASGLGLPFIVISGTIGEDAAVALMKAGAVDYLIKDRLARLPAAVAHALAETEKHRRLRQAETALRASEERFQLAARATSEFMWDLDFATGWTWCNQGYRDFMGWPRAPEGHTYEQWLAAVHPEDRPRIIAESEQFLAGAGIVWSGEYRLCRTDGSVAHVTDHAYLQRDAAGRPRRMIGAMQDITARKLTELALRRSEANLLAAQAIAKVGSSEYNPATGEWFWSPQLFRIFRLDPARGVPPRDQLMSLVHPDYRDAILRLNDLDHPAAGRGEFRFQLPDGSTLWTEQSNELTRDAAGRLVSIVGTSLDITERKEAEARLLRAQRLENLGMLAAGIAHDFNNALAPLVMGCPLLRLRMGDPGSQRLLDTMEKSAGRSVALVRQLLAFARGAGGESQLLQARHILREVLDLAEATFPKSIRITSHLPGELWPVRGNPSQVHQIFLNLCVNARDAMPHGGTLAVTAANTTLDTTAAARIADARPGSFLVVEVGDTGTGIPANVLARIWEPFFSTKGEGQGSGLGLSTVRGILHHAGGFATVKTSEGHGTTFAIYLPAAEEGAVGARPASAPAAQPARGAGELILVVDDEEAVREIAASILADHDYRALTAGDGAEAIALFATRVAEVKLLLTDLQMPVLGGPALAAALRRMRPDLPVIAMSGADSRGSAVYKEFTTAFLAKPFLAETLLSLVRRTLDTPRPSPTETETALLPF